MFKYHKQLPPKIWEKNLTLNSIVSQTLQTITLEFVRYLDEVIGLPVSKADIHDAFIHGSVTNYYWDKHSDIDLCIVLDLSRIRESNSKINQNLFQRSFINSWLQTFDISIFGRGVDISLIEKNSVGKVGPMYSLPKDRWIVKPKRLSKKQLNEIKKVAARRYELMLKHCKYIIKHKMPADYADAYLATMQRKRIASMYQQQEQPITSMTMAFKMVRNTGIIKQLRKYARKERSRKFQLV